MPRPYEISYTIQDIKGGLGYLTVYVTRARRYDGLPDYKIEPSGVNDPEFYAWVLGSYIDRVIEGKITNINISTSIRLDDFAPVYPSNAPNYAYKGAPDIGSDVESGAEFTYITAQRNFFSHRLPTFSENYIRPDGLVDRNNPNVTDLIEMITNPDTAVGGVIEWTIGAVDARGEDIRVSLSAREDFQKSRKTKNLRK